MGAKPNIGNGDPMLRELLTHPLGERRKLLFCVVTPSNARLISYHNNVVALLRDHFTGFKHTGGKFKTLRLAHITVIDVNHAIAVEKKRFSLWCHNDSI